MRKSTKREDRISTEVVVDVYTSEERAIGWHYYLGGNSGFRFTAGALQGRRAQLLERGVR